MPVLLKNKKATLNYELLEKFEAGLELRGFEVKALKQKKGSLVGAHVIVRGGEAFLAGMNLPPYQPKNTPSDYDSYRPRRLLLKSAEINTLVGKDSQKGLTIIPLSIYTKGRKLKLEIAVARGKKKYDKRQTIKKRQAKRRTDRILKGEMP